jgi:hypothetical protein
VERPGWLSGPPAQLVATLRAMAGAGLAHVSVYLGTDEDTSPLPALSPQALERFAPVLEALAAS